MKKPVQHIITTIFLCIILLGAIGEPAITKDPKNTKTIEFVMVILSAIGLMMSVSINEFKSNKN